MGRLLNTKYFLLKSQYALKEKIRASDYKVIKAAECATLNIECEYDLSVLHAERQAIRDEINRLELEIAGPE